MEYIIEGFKEALKLLINLDKETYQIVILSIMVSGLATILSSLISIPLGIFLGLLSPNKTKLISKLVYTFMSIPTVIVGLLVAILLSRNGPLGALELMYTPTAMIIAQVILLLPLITGLTYGLTKNLKKDVINTGITLGGRKIDIIKLVILEYRKNLLVNIISGFSRAISEVGVVMMVGGNIKGQTRVMTTAISLSNSMGNYSNAIALGIVLLLISFLVNSAVYKFEVES